MAGCEEGSPPDEDTEWSDFSGNSSTFSAFDDVLFGRRPVDPVAAINTLKTCFPCSSGSTSTSDEAPRAEDRILDGVDPSLQIYGEPLKWRGSLTEKKFSRALNLPSCSCEANRNHLAAHQHEEDTDFLSSRTFDFHKLAEKLSLQSSSPRWSSDSNELPEDFVLSKSPDPPSTTADSDSENEDEIFLVFRGKPNSRLSSFDECQAAAGLSELSHGELLDLKHEMAAYVKEYSDVLVEELTLREELEREKEIKNKFISTLLTVQSRIRESQSSQGKGKKGSSSKSGKYLTTVIPYDDFGGGPSTKVLLRLIEIMEALMADSPTVPGLLTEYILKVLCAED